MRRVRNIETGLIKHWLKGSYEELTGEAYGRVKGTGAVLQNLKLLGLRKKRDLSPITVEKMSATLMVARDKKS